MAVRNHTAQASMTLPVDRHGTKKRISHFLDSEYMDILWPNLVQVWSPAIYSYWPMTIEQHSRRAETKKTKREKKKSKEMI